MTARNSSSVRTRRSRKHTSEHPRGLFDDVECEMLDDDCDDDLLDDDFDDDFDEDFDEEDEDESFLEGR